MSYDTPVVLIIFKRPYVTEKVFESIRQHRPKRLFVIADGPHPGKLDEAEKCAETRAIIDKVDWDCEVTKRYSEHNLGCGVNIFQGISWVFEQVEEAIILEDDCLPHPDFFRFCEEILQKHRGDSRIMHVSGSNNLLYYSNEIKYSYCYSRYPVMWGWATWKRAWEKYSFTMDNWIDCLEGGWLDRFFDDKRATYVWNRNLKDVYANQYSWGYQWFFTCWTQSGLAVMPKVNLVSNIGFGDSATHTSDPNNPWASLPVEALSFPLQHPPFIIRDTFADNHLQNTQFDPSKINRLSMSISKLLVEQSFGKRKS
jgi:hypothetical protein